MKNERKDTYYQIIVHAFEDKVEEIVNALRSMDRIDTFSIETISQKEYLKTRSRFFAALGEMEEK